MADFEGLIRQALARQDDSDPAIREKVYQSSRKALARMIASSGVQPPDVINRQRVALEDSIQRIEAGYQHRQAPRPVVEEPYLPPRRERDVADDDQHGHAWPVDNETVHKSDHAPFASGPDSSDVHAMPPPVERSDQAYGGREAEHGRAGGEHQRGREAEDSTLFRRIIAILALIAILGVIGWMGYALVGSLMDKWQSVGGATPPASSQGSDPADQDELANASYITVLSAGDTAALDTAGRGKAEIVSQSNLEMIRLVSLRPADARNEPAPPILVKLQEGVLPRIAGNRVTVEILAKSGSAGPATFAVGCDFGGQDLCGRKRFRVGIQPEAIVFTINVDASLATAKPAYLSISTDISNDAELTGEGDPLDLLYIRLRLSTG
ncbi:MAG: hypothetical protein LJE67_05380 [Salaquimonas sp.]|nr:hypothetical protein [Salaquimonas sp.]